MHTYRLDKNTDLLKLSSAAFGTKQNAGMSGYLRLPLALPDGRLQTPSWLLLLELTGKNHGMLPFEIAADVVIGRGSDPDDGPELDLTALGAVEFGLSRKHAVLRPTSKSLFLIDLGSTNGTFVNGLKITSGAHPLMANDHITLGKMNMRVISLVLASQAATVEPPISQVPIYFPPPTPSHLQSTEPTGKLPETDDPGDEKPSA